MRCYLARNEDYSKAIGLNVGLCNLKKRLQEKKRTPHWLLAKLDDLIGKSNEIIRPLRDRRDELEPRWKKKDLEEVMPE